MHLDGVVDKRIDFVDVPYNVKSLLHNAPVTNIDWFMQLYIFDILCDFLPLNCYCFFIVCFEAPRSEYISLVKEQ